jgi:hypothetical protein
MLDLCLLIPSFVKWAPATEGNILVTVALGCLILRCLFKKKKLEEDNLENVANYGAREC